MRRALVSLTLLWATCGISYAQDGADMKYLKPSELGSSHVGRSAHLDFGTRSFAFADHEGEKRPLSTVTIELDGRKYAFREHRVDDGFNNWFRDQYLESVEKIGGLRLRWVNNEILGIDPDWIRVKSHFVYVDAGGAPLSGRSFHKDLRFKKSELAEVLIKADK